MNNESSQREYVAAVGMFDGVHRGHAFLVDRLTRLGREEGRSTRLYTFADSPMMSLCPDRAPKLLTTLKEKIVLLDGLGVDEISVSDFGDVKSLTAHQYIERIALEGVRTLLVGYDTRFGCDRLSTLDQFRHAARHTPIRVEQAPELTCPDGSDINSSAIRRALTDGDIVEANDMLGREYRLTGVVGHGRRLGRKIGFPTANLELNPADCRKLVPRNGAYACRAHVNGDCYPAMVNIGHRPTVDRPDAPVSIEAHIVGLDADLYGKPMSLDLVARLRDEQQFPSLAALKTQLEADRRLTISIFSNS